MAASTQPGNAAQVATLRGSGPGQFNLDQVKARASELRTSLAEVLNALQHQPELLHWDAVLKKYATINLQVLSLRECIRGILKQVVVHPCMLDQPALSQVLPIQLASSVWPDQATAEQGLQDAEQQALSTSGLSQEQWYEATDMQLEEFNTLVTALTGGGGCLDQKGEGRRGMMSRSQAIARSLTAVRQGQIPKPSTGGPAKRGKTTAAAGGGGTSGSSSEPGGLDPALRQFLTGEVATKQPRAA